MGLHLKLKPSKCHRNSRSDVVTERDRSKEVFPINAEEFSRRQSGRHDCATRMRMRWGVRVAGLISVGQHAIHESRFRGIAQQIDPTTVALFPPPLNRAKSSATFAGGNSVPDTIAAIVSRTCSFAFSTTSGGRIRDRASAMYLLNSSITSGMDDRFCGELGFCAETHLGPAAVARIVPAPRKRFRRVSMDDLSFTSTPSWCG